jgi:hypothetical protein
MSTLRCLVYHPGQAEPVDISDQLRMAEVQITTARRSAADDWLAWRDLETAAWRARVEEMFRWYATVNRRPRRADRRQARKRRGKLRHQQPRGRR